MDRAYPPREFAKMVGRSVNTLRRWDRKDSLFGHEPPTNAIAPTTTCVYMDGHARSALQNADIMSMVNP